MEDKIKLLKTLIAVNGFAEITISGVSMNPVIHDGQIVRIEKCDEYKIGDILVYGYKNEGLLAHRLLKISDKFGGRYFCKGDNSLRLEDISFDGIIGKIVLENDSNKNAEFIAASLAISKLFRKSGFDAEKTRSSDEFAEFSEKYLRLV